MKTSTLQVNNTAYTYYDIQQYAASEGLSITHLPFSLKILLENLLRHSHSPAVSAQDIRSLAGWKSAKKQDRDIAYHPARVIMQDFTGVPAVVDLAAMRDAMASEGGDVSKINPQIPVDLVIDHSVMVDYFGSGQAFQKNVDLEFTRNRERYRFLKWGQNAFQNFRVVPPGTGIIHQVNLEYLARTVWTAKTGNAVTAYPDTVVGTDSHTTMINALGVLGWGVGGIEAEAAMLGQPVTMLIPEVVGFELTGRPSPGSSATDLVLKVVEMLRAKGVVGKFVEFYGEGLDHLSLADRATISNMAPEYGATCGFFPVDDELLSYLHLTGRDDEQIALVEAYAKAQGLWRGRSSRPEFNDTLKLDMSTVVPAMAGPRRPQDWVALKDIPANFRHALGSIYGVSAENTQNTAALKSSDHRLTHGDVAIAAITSCTNTSNPAVLVEAGLVAQKALAKGLRTKSWVKTSFAPGSQAVTAYLSQAGLMDALNEQGFQLVGYGCTTCIGNSGPLPEEVKNAIDRAGLVTVNVLSGNRNFEGRVSPDSKASYLASPGLVVAYALAGTVLIDFGTQPLGFSPEGEAVYLKDIWPSPEEISRATGSHLSRKLFQNTYADVFSGTPEWQKLEAPSGMRYDWQEESTYIRCPPFFDNFSSIQNTGDISGARVLAILPHSTTTDHISPAGAIPEDGPAGRYLKAHGTAPGDFNSFGSRRGNHEVMMRGTFANIRIKNPMAKGKEGGYTSDAQGNITSIYDAAVSWQALGVPLIILAGKEYGTGSSRDWAGKGPMLQGVKAVIAESYERIHRSNLVGMGILPLEFAQGGSVEFWNLDGSESFDICALQNLKPLSEMQVKVRRASGEELQIPVVCRIDTAVEMEYWHSRGILNYVLKNISRGK